MTIEQLKDLFSKSLTLGIRCDAIALLICRQVMMMILMSLLMMYYLDMSRSRFEVRQFTKQDPSMCVVLQCTELTD